MVWLVDDLAEAALGPWGIAVAVGVGLVSVTRRRAAQAAASAPTVTEHAAESATVAPASAAAIALAPVAAVTVVVGRVKDGVQQRMAEATEYWHDLYAEAHHEWEQARSGAPGALLPTAAAVAAPSATAASVRETAEPKPASKRVRGPNGRYVKDAP